MEFTSFGNWLVETKPLGLPFARWLNLWGSATEVTFTLIVFWLLGFIVPKVKHSSFWQGVETTINSTPFFTRPLFHLLITPIRLFTDLKFFLRTLFYVAGFSFIWAPNHYLQRCLLHSARCGDYGAFEQWQGRYILGVYHTIFWSNLFVYLVIRSFRKKRLSQMQAPLQFVFTPVYRQRAAKELDHLFKFVKSQQPMTITQLAGNTQGKQERFQEKFMDLLEILCQEAEIEPLGERKEIQTKIFKNANKLQSAWTDLDAAMNAWNHLTEISQVNKANSSLKRVFFKDNLVSLFQTTGINTRKRQYITANLFYSKIDFSKMKYGILSLVIGFAIWIPLIIYLNKAVEETAGYVSDYEYFYNFECPHEIPYTTVEGWIKTLPVGDTNH